MTIPDIPSSSPVSPWPLQRLPLASLTPEALTNGPAYFAAVVTLLWPFSSSGSSMSFLACEEDFRLRFSKGQLNVNFQGPSAQEVYSKNMQIGDQVLISLEGAIFQELKDATTRDVPWSVTFSQRLVMKIKTTSGWSTIDFEAPRDEPPLDTARSTPKRNNSPSPATPPNASFSFSQNNNEWNTPGLFKRGNDWLSHDDSSSFGLRMLFGDEDDDEDEHNSEHRKKRPRFSNSYRFVERDESSEVEKSGESEGNLVEIDENVGAQDSEMADEPMEDPHHEATSPGSMVVVRETSLGPMEDTHSEAESPGSVTIVRKTSLEPMEDSHSEVARPEPIRELSSIPVEDPRNEETSHEETCPRPVNTVREPSLEPAGDPHSEVLSPEPTREISPNPTEDPRGEGAGPEPTTAVRKISLEPMEDSHSEVARPESIRDPSSSSVEDLQNEETGHEETSLGPVAAVREPSLEPMKDSYNEVLSPESTRELSSDPTEGTQDEETSPEPIDVFRETSLELMEDSHNEVTNPELISFVRETSFDPIEDSHNEETSPEPITAAREMSIESTESSQDEEASSESIREPSPDPTEDSQKETANPESISIDRETSVDSFEDPYNKSTSPESMTDVREASFDPMEEDSRNDAEPIREKSTDPIEDSHNKIADPGSTTVREILPDPKEDSYNEALSPESTAAVQETSFDPPGTPEMPERNDELVLPNSINMQPPSLPLPNTHFEEDVQEIPRSPPLRPIPSPQLPLVSPFLIRGLPSSDYLSAGQESPGNEREPILHTLIPLVQYQFIASTATLSNDESLTRSLAIPEEESSGLTTRSICGGDINPTSNTISRETPERPLSDDQTQQSDIDSEKDSLFDELSGSDGESNRLWIASQVPKSPLSRTVESAKIYHKSKISKPTKLKIPSSIYSEAQKDSTYTSEPRQPPFLYLPTPSPKTATQEPLFPTITPPKLILQPDEDISSATDKSGGIPENRRESAPIELSAYFGRPKSKVTISIGETPSNSQSEQPCESPPASLNPSLEEETAQDDQRMGPDTSFDSGITTSLSDYPGLSSLRWGAIVDIIGVVAQCAPIARAKHGPKDFYLSMRIIDSSMPTGIMVTILRPYRNALPVVEVGDVILLRSFKISSGKRSLIGTSTSSSAWAVWKNMGRTRPATVPGPPVEYGEQEEEYVEAIGTWYELLDESIKEGFQQERAEPEDNSRIGQDKDM